MDIFVNQIPLCRDCISMRSIVKITIKFKNDFITNRTGSIRDRRGQRGGGGHRFSRIYRMNNRRRITYFGGGKSSTSRTSERRAFASIVWNIETDRKRHVDTLPYHSLHMVVHRMYIMFAHVCEPYTHAYDNMIYSQTNLKKKKKETSH